MDSVPAFADIQVRSPPAFRTTRSNACRRAPENAEACAKPVGGAVDRARRVPPIGALGSSVSEPCVVAGEAFDICFVEFPLRGWTIFGNSSVL